MKRVINGRRYDSDKATLIGEHISGEPMEAGYRRETLYRKRGGEHFLVVQGAYTYDIVPLKYKDAEEWYIYNMGQAAYTEEFESQGITTVNVTMTLACKRKLDQMANATGSTRGQVVEASIMSMWDKMESDNIVTGD